MTAPLTRDQQIELMKSAKKRHLARMNAWTSNRTVREAVCRPAPGQEDEPQYLREDKRLACCG